MLSSQLIFTLLIVNLVSFSCTHYEAPVSSKSPAKTFVINSLTPSCPSRQSDYFIINEVEKRLSSPDFYQKCLKNHFQINPIKEMLLSGCIDLHLSSYHQVKAVKFYEKVMPESLRWCVEQELWSFDYKLFSLGLLSDKKFAINFKWLVTPHPLPQI